MDKRRLVIALTVGLCAIPPFAWTAHARTPDSPPPVQQVEPSHAASQSPGAHVREHQRARLESMAEENARIKEQSERLAGEIAAMSGNADGEEDCRILKELALALCAAATEQEHVILKLGELLRYHDTAPTADQGRERDEDRGTDRIEQHLGAVIHSMSELVKAVDAVKPLLSP